MTSLIFLDIVSRCPIVAREVVKGSQHGKDALCEENVLLLE